MNYDVVIAPHARRQLEKLARSPRARIADAMNGLAKNPRPAGAKKLATQRLWRIRVGEYRVIYDIADQIRVVSIEEIVHRRDAYRDL